METPEETATYGRVPPHSFLLRRLHSLTGIWLAIYLFFHLLTNSQAALFIGANGTGFIESVNSIHELPYLIIIEILLLGVPILIHAIWGIIYIRSARYNSFGPKEGQVPYLPEYPRNRAYTWQRITSWLLVVGIVAHVIHMRIIEYPLTASKEGEQLYIVKVTDDEGLHTLAPRIGVKLYDQHQVSEIKDNYLKHAFEKRSLKSGELMAVANNFGAVELLMVRDTFKMPIMIVLYTLLVLAACYHAYNGLWTAMISWGFTLTQRSQRLMRTLTNMIMIIVALMGLSAIWLTYWINLKS